jgi:formylglycine-generating enzyme required for sulfatase activity
MRFYSVLFTFLIALPSFSQAAETTPTAMPKEVLINGVEFVHVPEGWFWHVVGTGDRNYTPPGQTWFRDVEIWLDGYYVAKYEARARDFKRFIESGAAKHLAEYRWGEREGCALQKHGDEGDWFLVKPELDLPVTHLSWNLADEFARWMGFRLLRETEWVKAARGSDKRPFPWGEEYPDDTFGGFGVASGCNPTPVDAFPNGKSPYGIYNMAGNVLELVQDWENHQHDKAMKDGDRNPPPASEGSLEPGYEAPMKISKGGRWGSKPNFLHVHGRRYLEADKWFICYGTRFAIDERTVREHLNQGTAKVVLP